MKQEHLNGQEISLEKCLPDNVAGIQGPHCGLKDKRTQKTNYRITKLVIGQRVMALHGKK